MHDCNFLIRGDLNGIKKFQKRNDFFENGTFLGQTNQRGARFFGTNTSARAS